MYEFFLPKLYSFFDKKSIIFFLSTFCLCFPLQYVNERLFRYLSKFVENIGVEPMTSCVQGRRSSQLS